MSERRRVVRKLSELNPRLLWRDTLHDEFGNPMPMGIETPPAQCVGISVDCPSCVTAAQRIGVPSRSPYRVGFGFELMTGLDLAKLPAGGVTRELLVGAEWEAFLAPLDGHRKCWGCQADLYLGEGQVGAVGELSAGLPDVADRVDALNGPEFWERLKSKGFKIHQERAWAKPQEQCTPQDCKRSIVAFQAPVSLGEVRSAPNPRVIGELERLLEEAKTGQVQGFTAVIMNPGGQSSSCFCGDFDADKALWAIECWKVRLLRGVGA